MISSAPVLWYDTLDSTSEEAKRRAKSGDVGPAWIAAHSQTSGRGRLGRTWASPPGNLFTTALYAEPGGLEMARRTAFAAGLAALDACQSFIPGAQLELKWPNDVRSDGAKLCGILIESGHSDGALWVAAGIGINVAEAPEGTGQKTQSLAGLGAALDVTATRVLEALDRAFWQRLDQARKDFAGLLQDWEAVAEGKGAPMIAGPQHSRVEGVFEGLKADGSLILRLQDGARHTINTGDVDIVRHSDR